MHRIVGRLERRRLAPRVVGIAAADVGQHLFVVDGPETAVDVLPHATMGALFVARGQEHFHGSVREDHRPDIAAFDHEVACRANAPLLSQERFAHGRQGRNRADRTVDLRRANGIGHFVAVDEHASRHRVARLMAKRDLFLPRNAPACLRVVERHAVLDSTPGHCAVHRACVQAREAELFRHRLCDGGLPRPAGAVYRYDHRTKPSMSSKKRG